MVVVVVVEEKNKNQQRGLRKKRPTDRRSGSALRQLGPDAALSARAHGRAVPEFG